MRTPLRTAALFLVAAGRALARTCPDTDAAHDQCNQLRLVPSAPGAGVCLGLWALLALALTADQITWPCYRLLPAILGAWAVSGGLLIRTLYASRPHWVGGFVGLAILHWVGAWLITPAITVIFAHVVSHLGGEAYLPGQWSTRKLLHVFLWTDALWLVLQSLGGFLGSFGASGARATGEAFYLIGLLGQLVFLLLLATFFVTFLVRSRADTRLWSDGPRPLAYCLAWALFWLVQRACYRAALFRGGYKGYLRRGDAQFLVLDVVSLWLALAPFAYFWPGRLLRATNRAASSADEWDAPPPMSEAPVAPTAPDADAAPPMPANFIYKTSPEYQQRVDALRAEIKLLEDEAKHAEATARGNGPPGWADATGRGAGAV
ncbi:hypothetical protein Q8F55_004685 [Vanrija albida]|uniref:Uncharacterized protein n=1 Tax=Vanrija albida TaxID=181172 RepID=A0ABR3Q7E8_9TREE